MNLHDEIIPSVGNYHGFLETWSSRRVCNFTLQKMVSLSFCSPLYDEIISLCLDLGELDAAVAIVADMETAGIAVPDHTLDRVISARQGVDSVTDDVPE